MSRFFRWLNSKRESGIQIIHGDRREITLSDVLKVAGLILSFTWAASAAMNKLASTAAKTEDHEPRIRSLEHRIDGLEPKVSAIYDVIVMGKRPRRKE